MASSTSKSTGRCSSGSSVRWPGSTSRSSQVTSARHERATRGSRAASLAPCSAARRRCRPQPALGPAARERRVLGDARRSGRDLDAERAQRLDVLDDPEPARRRQPPRHDGLDAERRVTAAAAGRGRRRMRRLQRAGRAGRTAAGTGRAGGSRRLPRRPRSSVPGPMRSSRLRSDAAGQQLGPGPVPQDGRHDGVPQHHGVRRVRRAGAAGRLDAREEPPPLVPRHRGDTRHGERLPRQASGRVSHVTSWASAGVGERRTSRRRRDRAGPGPRPRRRRRPSPGRPRTGHRRSGPTSLPKHTMPVSSSSSRSCDKGRSATVSTSIQTPAVALQQPGPDVVGPVVRCRQRLPPFDVEVGSQSTTSWRDRTRNSSGARVPFDGLETEVEILRAPARRCVLPVGPHRPGPVGRSSGRSRRGGLICSPGAARHPVLVLSGCRGVREPVAAVASSQPGRPHLRPLRRAPCRRAALHRRAGPHLDDFWAFPDDRDGRWKWRNGDIMLSRWFTGAARRPSSGIRCSWRSGTWSWWRRWRKLLPPLGGGGHAHLRGASRPRGGAVVAVDAGRRPAASTTRSWTTWRRRFGAGRGPAVLSIHRPRGAALVHGRATPASTSPSSGSWSTRSPSTPRSSGSRSSPTRASGRGGPRSRPRRGPRAPRRLVHAWATPVRLPVMLYEARRPGGRRIFHPYHGIYPHDAGVAGRRWPAADAGATELVPTARRSRAASMASTSVSSDSRASASAPAAITEIGLATGASGAARRDPRPGRRHVVRLHEVLRQPSGEDLGVAAHARGDHRHAARQRLHHRTRQRLGPQARGHRHVGGLDEADDVGASRQERTAR